MGDKIVNVTADMTEFHAALKRIRKLKGCLGMWCVEAEKARRDFEEQWEKIESTLGIGETP